MYKFKDFILVEKVSNQEIKAVLNDPNLLIGIEFEFLLDDLDETPHGYDGYTWGELDDKWSYYMKEIQKYIDEVKETRDNYFSEVIKPASSQLVMILKKQVRESQAKIDDMKSKLDNFATTNKEELQDMIYDEQDFRDEAKRHITEIKDYVRDKDVYVLLEILHEELDDKIPDQIDYVNENMSAPPEPQRVLYNFYQDYAEINIGSDAIEWWEVFSDPEWYDLNKIRDVNNWYSAPSDLGEDGYDLSDANAYENYENWDELPFKDYIISDYHGTSSNTSHWRIEPDSSLNKGGVEIISPAMPVSKMLKILPKMFDFIKKHGKTDSSTGMHINLSYKGKTFADADMLKLMLFVDEGWVWKNFPERRGNIYTASVLKSILDSVQNNKKTEPTAEKYVAKSINDFKKGIKGPASKFFGVNTTHSNRIEFRYLGGTNYHKKLKDVTTAIGKFGFFTKIALDERARKKEYILKLNRLHQKFNKKSGKEVTDIDQLMDITSKGKKLNPRTKEDNATYYLYKRKKYKLVRINSNEFNMYQI